MLCLGYTANIEFIVGSETCCFIWKKKKFVLGILKKGWPLKAVIFLMATCDCTPHCDIPAFLLCFILCWRENSQYCNKSSIFVLLNLFWCVLLTSQLFTATFQFWGLKWLWKTKQKQKQETLEHKCPTLAGDQIWPSGSFNLARK